MTKYQYEEGKVYTSESTPITVSRIPSGTYKIQVVNGTDTGEYVLTTKPGTQKVSIVARASDWDLSNATIVWQNFTFYWIQGITGTYPDVDTARCTQGDIEYTIDVSGRDIVSSGIQWTASDLSQSEPVLVELLHSGVVVASANISF